VDRAVVVIARVAGAPATLAAAGLLPGTLRAAHL